MISKEAIRKLRDELPRGSAPVIQKRLLEKGKVYHLNTINATLDPDNTRFNPEIFDEAILYRDDLRREAMQLEKKAMS